MKCPKCRHDHTRVIDTKDTGYKIRRYRMCRRCGHNFVTLEMAVAEAERDDDFSAGNEGYDEDPAALEPVTEEVPAEPVTEKPVTEERRVRFRAGPGHVPAGTTMEAAKLLLEWWNSSRWARHGKRAAWTEEAFRGSAERLAVLPAQQQVELAQAGVEGGWMALKSDYLAGKPRRLGADQFAPTDPQLVEAMNGAF